MGFHDDSDRPFGKPRTSRFSASPSPAPAPSLATINAHKAALEALFAPKQPTPTPGPVAKRDSAKMITARPRGEDPRDQERAKLLAKLLAAQGRPAVSKCADDFARAGFPFPDEQEVHLQLLEHLDEARVREGLEGLARRLDAGEAPKRRTVLDSRLRRLEDAAEDAPTRTLAESLRRRLATIKGRG